MQVASGGLRRSGAEADSFCMVMEQLSDSLIANKYPYYCSLVSQWTVLVFRSTVCLCVFVVFKEWSVLYLMFSECLN